MCAADWRRELSAGEKIGMGHGFRRGQKHGGHMAKDKGQVGGAQEIRSHEGWRAWSRIRKIQPGIPAVPLGGKGAVCVSSLSDLRVFLVCRLRITLATVSLSVS